MSIRSTQCSSQAGQAIHSGLLLCCLLLCCLLPAPAVSSVKTSNYLSFATNDEANSTEIFSKASPAVVFVTNKALRRSFFSLDVHEIPRGSGSGFVWDNNGLIVTNFHVIAGAQRLTVTFQDQSEYDAEIVGIAPGKDLAVLRIKEAPKDLVSLPLGDSSELTVGRKVLAIGNPFGLDTTLTTGVVSALGREIKASGNRTIRGVIQTDAAINPGNSGGPLLNSMGQLVGVNTAIYSPSGASAGIGFAIPVNTLRDVIPQLIAYGSIQRPVMGIELASDIWIHRYRIKGVPVVRTLAGMPADKAGIRGAYRNRVGEVVLGDIITRINDREIRNNDDFLNLLESHKAGDVVRIELHRGEQQRTVELTLVASE
ncbi:MAG: S1C family serine protease [Parahaliea sp.]